MRQLELQAKAVLSQYPVPSDIGSAAGRKRVGHRSVELNQKNAAVAKLRLQLKELIRGQLNVELKVAHEKPAIRRGLEKGKRSVPPMDVRPGPVPNYPNERD